MERVSKLLIDATNGQLREFAGLISRDFFFNKNTLKLRSKEEFITKCTSKKFSLVKPQEIRERFIQSVEQKANFARNSINFSTVNYPDKQDGRGSQVLPNGILEEEIDFDDDDEDIFASLITPKFKGEALNTYNKITRTKRKEELERVKEQKRSLEQQLEKPKFTFTAENLERNTFVDRDLKMERNS